MQKICRTNETTAWFRLRKAYNLKSLNMQQTSQLASFALEKENTLEKQLMHKLAYHL